MIATIPIALRTLSRLVLTLGLTATLAATASATDLSGHWSGHWISCTSGHKGPLEADFCKICETKYPMSLWLKDDLIMDDHEFTLEPNFSPGPYTLWFGLFVGEQRLKLKSGPSDSDNRVNGGTLRVQ